MFENGNDNDDDNFNDIMVFIKDTKSFVPVVTLSAKDNQMSSKVLSKGFERSVYWNEYNIKNKKYNQLIYMFSQIKLCWS